MKACAKTVALYFAAIAVWIASQSTGRAVSFSVTPSLVANTYNGAITLQIGGLTPGDTVVVQKYLDVDSNGVVDAGDGLVQQFNLTDGHAGMVIGGVTNLNVPGDTDEAADGKISATLNFQNGDFTQNIVGRYLLVLSSPSGHFSPFTNSLTVTNFPFGQKISGVVSSGAMGVPNAIVIIFPAPRGESHGPGNPLAGTVADGIGAFTVQLPPGTYVPLAFESNYFASYPASPILTLGGGQIIFTNLYLTNATESISGQIVDANNSSIGLPGILLPTSSQSGLIAVAFSESNGDFNVGVDSGSWSFGSDDSGLIVLGYVGYSNGTNLAAGTSDSIDPFPKATAMFYGAVKDGLGNPVAGVDVQSSDNANGEYQSDGYSDTNGNYFVGVVGGLGSGDPWMVQVSDHNSPTNYIYSQPAFDQQNPIGGTNLAVGQALRVNFTALAATTRITGNVEIDGTNIAGVNVFAFAMINGAAYSVNANTGNNGNYSLNVADGVWNIGVNCNGGNGSLDDILGPGAYQCPFNQNITNGGTLNFVILSTNEGSISGYLENTAFHPLTNVTIYAGNGKGGNFSTNTDASGYYSFIVGNGTWDFSVDCGQLDSLGYQCAGSQRVNVSGDTVGRDFIVQPIPPPALISPSWQANRFSITLNGASNQNYTVQMSTNLSQTNWITLLVTNNPSANTFVLTDPNATNKQRFYRVFATP